MANPLFRGKEITKEDVITAMERFDKEHRAGLSRTRWKTYAIEYNGKLYPPKETLRLIVGYHDVGKGGKPVNAIYEELGFKIVTLGEQNEDVEEIEQEEAVETSISIERDLEDFIEKNLSQLEQGLSLYPLEEGSPRQFDTKRIGIIDLLAIDKKQQPVILELKAGEADDRVCGQIQRYMAWVKENIAKERDVRGIIVANAFTDNLRYAIKIGRNISLKKYSVFFRFSDDKERDEP